MKTLNSMNQFKYLAFATLATSLIAVDTQMAKSDAIANIQEVVSRPAFQQAPGATEKAAQKGQILENKTVLRTSKPGRMQVAFTNSKRSFRMGGNASLELNENTINHKSGQIIAWIAPGGLQTVPLKIRTRIATAAIRGTTLFIESLELKLVLDKLFLSQSLSRSRNIHQIKFI